MPFFSKKSPTESNVNEEDDGIVKIDFTPNPLVGDGNNEVEGEVTSTVMTASEFLAELEQLPSLQFNLNSSTNEEKPSSLLPEGGETEEIGGKDENQTPEKKDSGSSSNSSWASQFGELEAHLSDADSLWDSYYSAHYVPLSPDKSVSVLGNHEDARERGESSGCGCMGECEHGSSVVCSECCTCLSKHRGRGFVFVGPRELAAAGLRRSSTASVETEEGLKRVGCDDEYCIEREESEGDGDVDETEDGDVDELGLAAAAVLITIGMLLWMENMPCP